MIPAASISKHETSPTSRLVSSLRAALLITRSPDVPKEAAMATNGRHPQGIAMRGGVRLHGL